MLFKGYGAKVGLGNMRVKAENRMVTCIGFGKPKKTFKGQPREGKGVKPHIRIKENAALSNDFNTVRATYYLAMNDILEAKKDSIKKKERLE